MKKNCFVSSSQNWKFEQSYLLKEMEKPRPTAEAKKTTKIRHKSDKKIKVIVSHEPTSATVRTKVEAGISVPSLSIEAAGPGERKREIPMGEHPPQQAVVLPNSHEAFALPWNNCHMTVLTEQPDGSHT
jgi:hypothetical protein